MTKRNRISGPWWRDVRIRWRRATLGTKLMVIFTFGMLMVNTVYAIFAYWQLQKMSEQTRLSTRQTESMEEQLKIMQTTLKESRDSNVELGKHNQAVFLENKKLADASKETSKASELAAKAAEQSARFAQESFAMGERPWVMIKGANYLEIKVGQSPSAVLTIINTGNTPAFNVTTDTMIAFRNSAVPVPMPIKPRLNGEVASKSSIAPKTDMTIIITHNVIMTEGLIKRLKEENYRLYVWGRIEYEDIFKRRHKTEFCGVQRMGTLNFDLCDNNNTAN